MRIGSDNSDQPNASLVPLKASAQGADGLSPRQRLLLRWSVAGIVVLVAIALLWSGPHLWQLAQDREALEAWVAQLGWLGPLALITLNALQIVIAPIPGYVVQVAA